MTSAVLLKAMSPRAHAGLSRIVGTFGNRAASFRQVGMPTSGRPQFRWATPTSASRAAPSPGVVPGLSRPQRDVLTARRQGLLPAKSQANSNCGNYRFAMTGPRWPARGGLVRVRSSDRGRGPIAFQRTVFIFTCEFNIACCPPRMSSSRDAKWASRSNTCFYSHEIRLSPQTGQKACWPHG